jgi:superfamily II helicase
MDYADSRTSDYADDVKLPGEVEVTRMDHITNLQGQIDRLKAQNLSLRKSLVGMLEAESKEELLKLKDDMAYEIDVNGETQIKPENVIKAIETLISLY